MKGFVLGALKGGVLLNTPPLLLLIISLMNLDIFVFVFLALLWANVPLQYVGLESLFEPSQFQFSEWGLNEAAPIVWLSIVIFWFAVSAVGNAVLLVFKRKRT